MQNCSVHHHCTSSLNVLVKILQNLEITLSSKVIMTSVSNEVLKQIYRLDQFCVLAMNFSICSKSSLDSGFQT
jgi:hypothetical protein